MDAEVFALADGRDLDTLDGQPFLTANGVQRLGRRPASRARQIERLRMAGIAALRLSPQSHHFGAICGAYAATLAGHCDQDARVARLRPAAPGGHLPEGFPDARPGADRAGAAIATGG
ncbi:hypothetical protein ACFQXB_08500 [Plastorhodobacter daqingensis]|uniref:DUF4224 domain-containing protein n=1 Tax=Plastorhodobacter daqingensis TaxID=1387281 RepID=A0ABW2UL27_9RHOB